MHAKGLYCIDRIELVKSMSTLDSKNPDDYQVPKDYARMLFVMANDVFRKRFVSVLMAAYLQLGHPMDK